MVNRDTFVTVVAFIAAIFATIALIARLGAAVMRRLLLKLYHVLFPNNNSKDSK